MHHKSHMYAKKIPYLNYNIKYPNFSVQKNNHPHIEDDYLLIWIDGYVIDLLRIGSHSELFR